MQPRSDQESEGQTTRRSTNPFSSNPAMEPRRSWKIPAAQQSDRETGQIDLGSYPTSESARPRAVYHESKTNQEYMERGSERRTERQARIL